MKLIVVGNLRDKDNLLSSYFVVVCSILVGLSLIHIYIKTVEKSLNPEKLVATILLTLLTKCIISDNSILTVYVHTYEIKRLVFEMLS